MKTPILVPLFAALVFTGVARSENPGQPHPDGPPPAGPMAERLQHRLEELRRDGKNEEADRLQRHAREMWEHHRGNPQGGRREESHRGMSMPPVSPGERADHLAEAAKHLRAAGIEVSPEMLERLGHRAPGKMEHRWPGSPGEGGGSASGQPPFLPRGGPAPGAGAGSPLEAMHHEIRTLARQVQELRGMIQHQRGGEPNRGSQDRNFQRPNDAEHRGDRARGEQHRDQPAAPEAAREHRDGQPRHQGDDRPRGEGNPPPHGDRPHGDAPVPPPAG